MIKNIIFDMGGVLITFDRHLFISRLGVSPDDEQILLREVYLSVEWAKMDRGSLTDEEAEKIIWARTPQHLHDAVHKLVTMWDRPILPIEGMEELVADLKSAGYRIFLLSNASYRQHEYWPRIPAAKYFDDTLISADVGLIKPQPEIYFHALEKFGIEAGESVFIDDSPWNIEGALNAGMHGIVFHGDVQEARIKLREMSVAV